jgi:SAM-dependent methyltransferase
MPKRLRMLDWACGSGRHSLFALELGFEVLALDQNVDALAQLRSSAGQYELQLSTEQADLEGAALQIPALQQPFDVIVVTNYLFRPRLSLLPSFLAADGLLIYETFAYGNARFGRPSRDDFLLAPHEAYERFRAAGLNILAFEQGVVTHPKQAQVQRVAACVASVSGDKSWQIDEPR